MDQGRPASCKLFKEIDKFQMKENGNDLSMLHIVFKGCYIL